MSEDDYIKVTDLAKMRAAAAVLRNVTGTIADNTMKTLAAEIAILEMAVDRIQITESET